MFLAMRSARTALQAAVRTMTTDSAKVAATAKAAEIDAQAFNLYRAHEQSFYNIPVEKVEFEVYVNERTKKPEPKMVYDKKPVSGLSHLSPCALVKFADFSETGTLGRKMVLNGAEVVVQDLAKATLEVCLSTDPLASQQKENTVMLEYINWMEAIKNKFVVHVAQNAKTYPAATNRLKGLPPMSDESLIKFFDTHTRTPARTLKPYPEPDGPSAQVVIYKNRLYRGQREEETIAIRCHSDEEMKERHMVRMHVPLFDHAGVEIPVSDSKLFYGDVVTIKSVLRPMLLEIAGNTFQGLKHEMRSVVLLRARERAASALGSPFKTTY